MRITFHVGLHKTATTWLQSVFFKAYPDIHLINNYNEPWNDEIIRYLVLKDRYSFDPEVFRGMVEERIDGNGLMEGVMYLISAERLSGHPFSGGYDREKIIRNIHSAYPNAKILITIRNQVDIIQSTYQQLVREGDMQKISELLRQDCWKKPCFNLSYYDYEKMHRMYSEFFDETNLGFFFFEDFVKNRERFSSQLCSFLGISERDLPEVDKVNSSVSMKELTAIRLLNRFRKTEYVPFPIFNLASRLLFNIATKIIKVLVINENNQLSHSDIEFIKKYYSKSNLLLASKLSSEKKLDSRYLSAS